MPRALKADVIAPLLSSEALFLEEISANLGVDEETSVTGSSIKTNERDLQAVAENSQAD